MWIGEKTGKKNMDKIKFLITEIRKDSKVLQPTKRELNFSISAKKQHSCLS